MQERLVFAGQSDVYSEATDLISKYLCVETNAMQIHRMTNYYGELAEELVSTEEAEKIEIEASDIVYAQVDGGMVLTREDAWSEVKLGRVFCHKDIRSLSESRQELHKSLYVGHLGHCESFVSKMEKITDVFDGLHERLVFITDGARWIKNWCEESYPQATQILDFYHACEHLSAWLELSEKDKEIRKTTLEKWKTTLKETGIDPILLELSEVTKTSTLKKEAEKLMNYLESNRNRMNYASYIKRGLCIGSGAIEAAHRTVVQKRMKLSGQRWAEKGVKNMLNLRIANQSGYWHKVIKLICSPPTKPKAA
jgi:hypothetical protein